MAKLNWFLSLKNMAKSDETAKTLLESINSAESDELKEKAKAEAKEYVESFSEPEPEHIEPVSEVEQAENELTVDLDTPEETGERPQPEAPVNQALLDRIARRQKIAEDNAQKRRNQPVTLSERRAWAEEKAREIDERNKRMAAMRAEIKAQVTKAQEEARKANAKNMVGLLTILLRELKLNIRLEVICKKHGFTRKDLEMLKTNNPAGWQECLQVRPKIEKEMDIYIKE